MPDEDSSWWPSTETLSDIGHGVLDVAGLVPGLGEPADIANAAWYAAQGNYLEAGLSLISAIPFVGYAGTVGKLVKKFGVKPSKAALEALQKVDFGKALERFRSNRKLAPYVDKIVAALDKWRNDLLGKFSPKVTPGRCVECETAAAATRRLPQDVAVNPVPPSTLPLNRPIGKSATQNAKLQADIKKARAEGGSDFRVNQQQVDATGTRVGANRPDLQYTDANGRRVYVEYDTKISTRGPGHETRIRSNDPVATVKLEIEN